MLQFREVTGETLPLMTVSVDNSSTMCTLGCTLTARQNVNKLFSDNPAYHVSPRIVAAEFSKRSRKCSPSGNSACPVRSFSVEFPPISLLLLHFQCGNDCEDPERRRRIRAQVIVLFKRQYSAESTCQGQLPLSGFAHIILTGLNDKSSGICISAIVSEDMSP